jgi:hypothetical protein
MQFWDYFTHFQWAKGQPALRQDIKGMDASRFYGWYLSLMDSKARETTGRPIEQIDPFTPTLLALERNWSEQERPYYNLWPGIIPALSKLKMDADASHFRLPLDQLLLRFPKGDHPLRWEHGGQQWEVRTVLCENSRLVRDPRPGVMPGLLVPEGAAEPDTVRGLTFWIDAGESIDGEQVTTDGAGAIRRLMYKHLVCEEGHSIEWSFEKIPAHVSTEIGLVYPEWVLHAVARIVCTVCLMADDPEIMEPVVLRDDAARFEKTGEQALVDKARRRGHWGWNVGKGIEVSPHVRAASPAALYWTGEGRKIPKIRFRRGSIVHRKKFAQVPTGFLEEKGDAG